MIRLAAVSLILVAVAAVRANAEEVFLVVAASSRDPGTIASVAAKFAPNALIVNTANCGEQNHFYTLAVEISNSLKAARSALGSIKSAIRDAYIKKCAVTPSSLLSYRISAVDRSIAAIPKNAVNWSAADRVSTTLPISQDESLVILRHFDNIPGDPLEGRRDRILLAKSSGKKVVLTENCLDLANPATIKDLIAFDCVREEAGDQLLHSVVVVTAAGENIREIERCRNPKWVDTRELVCEAESVQADGRLVLNTIKSHIDH
jgi:hypothetical protein